MYINKKQQKLIKVYIVMFVLAFLIINWSDASWIFNYRVLYGLAYDFFNPYPNSILLISDNKNFLPIEKLAHKAVDDSNAYPYSNKNNSIEISNINITAPLVIGESTDLSLLEKNLNQGTVLYPESVLPGEIGQTIVLGHSAPPNWPRIKYDWVFSKINDLNFGDEVIIYFNNKKYVYKIVQKDIVDKGEEITKNILNGHNNVLVMISCWPPGKNYKRVAVQAELVKGFDKL